MIETMTRGEDEQSGRAQGRLLRSAEDGWEQPTGAEIQEIIGRTGLPGRAVAQYLAMSEYGGAAGASLD